VEIFVEDRRSQCAHEIDQQHARVIATQICVAQESAVGDRDETARAERHVQRERRASVRQTNPRLVVGASKMH
jgi:hypothetical protein